MNELLSWFVFGFEIGLYVVMFVAGIVAVLGTLYILAFLCTWLVMWMRIAIVRSAESRKDEFVHDHEKPIGHMTDVLEDASGISIGFKLNEDGSADLVDDPNFVPWYDTNLRHILTMKDHIPICTLEIDSAVDFVMQEPDSSMKLPCERCRAVLDQWTKDLIRFRQ